MLIPGWVGRRRDWRIVERIWRGCGLWRRSTIPMSCSTVRCLSHRL